MRLTCVKVRLCDLVHTLFFTSATYIINTSMKTLDERIQEASNRNIVYTTHNLRTGDTVKRSRKLDTRIKYVVNGIGFVTMDDISDEMGVSRDCASYRMGSSSAKFSDWIKLKAPIKGLQY